MQSSKSYSAFSLIELAIVLAILALGVGGGLTVLSSQDELNRIERTSDILDGLEEALQAFYAANGRLPCPADKSLAVNDDWFGLEWTDEGNEPACEQASGEPNSNNEIRRIYNDSANDSEEIWIGTVPTRTLGLPDRFGFDGWDSKLSYAIPRALGNENDVSAYDARTPDHTEDIIIIDKEGAVTATPADKEDNRLNPDGEEVAYVLVSHGGDKIGTYNRTGASTGTCNDATQDGINCSHNVSSSTDEEDATFRDQRVRDSDIEASFYYDYIRWKTLNNFRFEASSAGIASFRWETLCNMQTNLSASGSTTLSCAADEFLMSVSIGDDGSTHDLQNITPGLGGSATSFGATSALSITCCRNP